jgi:hypothetical protein
MRHYIIRIIPLALVFPAIFASADHDGARHTLIGDIIFQSIGLVNLLLLLLSMIAFGVFLYGIVKLIFSASNAEEVKKARGILWWGVIGLAVLASIGGIVYYLQVVFGVDADVVEIPLIEPLR